MMLHAQRNKQKWLRRIDLCDNDDDDDDDGVWYLCGALETKISEVRPVAVRRKIPSTALWYKHA